MEPAPHLTRIPLAAVVHVLPGFSDKVLPSAEPLCSAARVTLRSKGSLTAPSGSRIVKAALLPGQPENARTCTSMQPAQVFCFTPAQLICPCLRIAGSHRPQFCFDLSLLLCPKIPPPHPPPGRAHTHTPPPPPSILPANLLYKGTAVHALVDYGYLGAWAPQLK